MHSTFSLYIMPLAGGDLAGVEHESVAVRGAVVHRDRGGTSLAR